MTIHKEGTGTLLITIIALAAINAIAWFYASDLVQNILWILSALFFLIVLQFFRKPTRKTPINPQHIIAPADGKVVVIEEVMETEYFNDKRIQVSIFMSPLNVHINFNPLGDCFLLQIPSG